MVQYSIDCLTRPWLWSLHLQMSMLCELNYVYTTIMIFSVFYLIILFLIELKEIKNIWIWIWNLSLMAIWTANFDSNELHFPVYFTQENLEWGQILFFNPQGSCVSVCDGKVKDPTHGVICKLIVNSSLRNLINQSINLSINLSIILTLIPPLIKIVESINFIERRK